MHQIQTDLSLKFQTCIKPRCNWRSEQ